MNLRKSCFYAGTVVHKRLTPRRHAFSYRVFSLLLDVDEIDDLDRESRLFSRGHFNLLSFNDRDFGSGDGTRVGDHVRELLASGGLSAFTQSVELLTFPRVLGYVFNPLSVYFCRDGERKLGAIVYEVTNTFHERRSYVIPVGDAGADGGVIVQTCAKEMYVSPFTAAEATYGFHIRPPGPEVVVGVDLREAGRPVLKTHFNGSYRAFDDKVIAGLLAAHPLLTLKVIGAIHVEAARLWMKGVPLASRQVAPGHAVSLVNSTSGKVSNG